MPKGCGWMCLETVLPLLSARPAVNLLAAQHHRILDSTKLYLLVTVVGMVMSVFEFCRDVEQPSCISRPRANASRNAEKYFVS